MHLTRTRRIWTALLLLGALAFAHASVSMAACSMERGAMGEVLAAETEAPCDCGTNITEFGPLYANRCHAHCTADLQLAGTAMAIMVDAVRGAAHFVPRAPVRAGRLRSREPSPIAAVPKRIQLHSFLV
ncbi:MAG: hypothetical protein WD886_04530 [Burkholderiales bacterium]